MIKLNVKAKYFYYLWIRRIVTGIFSLPILIYSLYVLICSFINHSSFFVYEQLMLIWISVPLLVVNTFFIIFGNFYIKKLKHEMIFDFCKIISSVKLPKILPKVVYVYTSHNDMVQSRVLQNIQQTYKNFEVWISEGSEKPEVIEASKKFALQHGLNFHAVGGNGSSNKADNLNSFLSKSGAKFDYLLITDADEVLDNQFVELALKMFFYKDFHNLGYVSPLNYVYPTNTLFSNIFGNQNDFVLFYQKDFSRNFIFSQYSNLYSASCLVSKKLLEVNNGLFPDGCLEDVYLESLSLRNGFSSVISPLTPCGQSFDKNIYAFYKRTMRIEDWSIKLLKTQKINNYNEKYSTWFNGLLLTAVSPLTVLFKWLFFTLAIWLFVFYWQNIFSNSFFIFSFCSIIGSYLISKIFKLIENSPLSVMNKWGWLALILFPIFALSGFTFRLQHWFNAMVLNKYSAFGGSGQKSKFKSKDVKTNILFAIGMIVCAILIAVITLSYYFTIGFTNPGICFLYILLIVLLSYLFLSFGSVLIMYCIGLIRSNKNYNENNFVYPKDFYKFKRIKQKFYEKYSSNKDYDLKWLEKQI